MAGQSDRHTSVPVHILKDDGDDNRADRCCGSGNSVLHCSACNRDHHNTHTSVVVSDFYTGDDCLLQFYVLPSELGLKIWA